jgi:acid phosphatase type 7
MIGGEAVRGWGRRHRLGHESDDERQYAAARDRPELLERLLQRLDRRGGALQRAPDSDAGQRALCSRAPAAEAPTNTSAPTISGSEQVGQTLTAAPGSWSGTQPISYAYQWRRCDAGGDVCTDIAQETAPTHGVVALDVGATLRVLVTASNSGGPATTASAATSVAPLPSPARDPVVAAAGDIACDPSDPSVGGDGSTECQQQATSDLLVGKGFASVLALGDNEYACGGYNAYLQSYDPTWGRVKSITRPVPGNHEYQLSSGTDCDATGNAGGYFSYFGDAAGMPNQGYYSFDIGQWHLIALNSNCSAIGGCGDGSPQETWLRADLQSHPNPCTLAYWHHPRFTSGFAGDDPEVSAFWQDLQSAGVDVVLNGHAHGYERFAPQDGGENYEPVKGMREFVIGTGGDDFDVFAISKLLSETPPVVCQHPVNMRITGDCPVGEGVELTHGVGRAVSASDPRYADDVEREVPLFPRVGAPISFVLESRVCCSAVDSGRCGARTSDLLLVRQPLSQLS